MKDIKMVKTNIYNNIIESIDEARNCGENTIRFIIDGYSSVQSAYGSIRRAVKNMKIPWSVSLSGNDVLFIRNF